MREMKKCCLKCMFYTKNSILDRTNEFITRDCDGMEEGFGGAEFSGDYIHCFQEHTTDRARVEHEIDRLRHEIVQIERKIKGMEELLNGL